MKIMQYCQIHNLTGRRIRELRKKKGLTQEQVAAQMQTAGIQVNQKAISRMESGDRIITDYELLRISEILDTPVNRLIEDSMQYIKTEEDETE